MSVVVPKVGASNTLQLIVGEISGRGASALLSTLNCFVLDYVLRQKASGSHLSFYVLNQLPFLTPRSFNETQAWSADQSFLDWLLPRVLELMYAAWDLQPFAQDCGYDGPPFWWDEERRFLLRCELDAAYFHLYGIERDDVNYIMETFPIFKRKDERDHGEYRTKRLILEIYDEMAAAIHTGIPYQTRLDPPPAHSSVAHDESTRPDWVAAPTGAS